MQKIEPSELIFMTDGSFRGCKLIKREVVFSFIYIYIYIYIYIKYSFFVYYSFIHYLFIIKYLFIRYIYIYIYIYIYSGTKKYLVNSVWRHRM